ncbi:MAG TPA: M23 family metallopeptidase [Geodermatophilus sp.]|nr:M23 family metallopeptidase [Geodermatophilus sp.]
MTSLHHDRLLDEGTAPTTGSASPLSAAPAPPSRRSSATSEDTATTTVPTPRTGEARQTDTLLADRDATGATIVARTARRALRASLGKARMIRGPRATDPTPAEAPAAAPAALADIADLADLAELAESTALAGVKELAEARPGAGSADGRPAVEIAPGNSVDAAPAPDTATGGRRRPPAAARRPAMYLAAALLGAMGLSLLTPGDGTLPAGAAEEAGTSVSVAEELGIDTRTQAAAIEADAAARLGEMAASRTAREDEQAAAAHAQAEADRLAAEAAAEAARPDAVLPVAGARLTSGFGARWGRLHGGIDLAAPMLTPEYAAMDGVVLEAGPASGYGQVVYIQHENGDVTVYGHMEQILVTPGQVVRAGDTIALLGNRGQSTGPHLHFEVHVGGIDGEKIDPLPYLRERGVAI